MSEKPLERLNYFNGQRLQAGDFKLEQDYHMRVRRWLNRSLYTPGIAMGLEVYAVPGAPEVRVNPGLAIDAFGREIILLESRSVPVMHDIGQGPTYEGSYVVIRYSEELLAQQDASCTPTTGCGDKAAAGGPSRVLAEPVIECVPDLPLEASGRVLLGRVLLAAGCASIASIDTGVRRYVGDTASSKVNQYALEGFRDLDSNNPQRIYFHIREQQPHDVILHLRSEQFPTYFYTEMGRHKHVFTPDQGILTSSPDPSVSMEQHSHAVQTDAGAAGPVETSQENNGGGHGHSMHARIKGKHSGATDGWIHAAVTDLDPNSGSGWDAPLLDVVGGSISGGAHTHFVSAITELKSITYDHKHTVVPTGGIGETGITDPHSPDYHARNDSDPLRYVDNLQLVLVVNGSTRIPLTQNVLTQLTNANPDWSGQRLGAINQPNHVFVTAGTGPIRLSFLPGLSFQEGEYCIELSVAGASNGGRILYNLYVE
ncbi:MAG: hypothetical protein ABI605_12590 [Rhizobacter sp.]